MKVRIDPASFEAEGSPGELLSEVLSRAGVHLQAVCGGKGTCGKCRVRLLSGTLAPQTDLEIDALGAKGIDDGMRLACQARLGETDAAIEIPDETLLAGEADPAASAWVHVDLEPVTQVTAVTLTSPSLDDQRPDTVRLAETLGVSLCENVELMRSLPGVLRRHAYSVDAVVHADRVTAVLPPEHDRPVLGLAVDIGTTTIAAELVDLVSGKGLGVAASTNPQGVAGADVISRIEYVSSRPDGLRRLKDLASDAVSHLAETLLRRSGHNRTDLFEVTVAGNPTMLHLLLELDPSAISVVPFTPIFRGPLSLHIEELGLEFAPGAMLYCLPIVSAYVGADIVAGLTVLSSMPDPKLPALFVDVGTNGEIALLTGSEIYACATAAGPAFEGARISCGMRAVPGAIKSMSIIDGRIALETIVGAEPRGICGSGLIDAAAVLMETGVIEPPGTLADAHDIPIPFRHLLAGVAEGYLAVQLAPGVTLTQRDVRELQLAKGAIQAGACILLREAGIPVSAIAAVYLAGAFGSYINADSAVRIGLVPKGISPDKLEFLGNTSLAGARMVLLSKEARSKAEELSRTVRYLELSGRPDFQTAFAEAMFFPERAEV